MSGLFSKWIRTVPHMRSPQAGLLLRLQDILRFYHLYQHKCFTIPFITCCWVFKTLILSPYTWSNLLILSIQSFILLIINFNMSKLITTYLRIHCSIGSYSSLKLIASCFCEAVKIANFNIMLFILILYNKNNQLGM